jgi:hypothetical protein
MDGKRKITDHTDLTDQQDLTASCLQPMETSMNTDKDLMTELRRRAANIACARFADPQGSARSTKAARPKASRRDGYLRLTPFKLPPLGSVADPPKAMVAIVAAVLFGGHSYSPNSAS